MGSPRILIIAGPNGAGKTTFASAFLPHEANCLTVINADLIAAGISPFSPDQAAIRAGRVMLSLVQEYVDRGRSFAFETTLSGLPYRRLIPSWRERGFMVKLIFLQLPSPEVAIARVRQRVQEGDTTHRSRPSGDDSMQGYLTSRTSIGIL
ncbi:MAG: zeta toxin family protein [Bryobacterales bacterium]|nr:zeta toxin family protein [Bryobacterales bacterium]